MRSFTVKRDDGSEAVWGAVILGGCLATGNDGGGKALEDEATHTRQINVAPGVISCVRWTHPTTVTASHQARPTSLYTCTLNKAYNVNVMSMSVILCNSVEISAICQHLI